MPHTLALTYLICEHVFLYLLDLDHTYLHSIFGLFYFGFVIIHSIYIVVKIREDHLQSLENLDSQSEWMAFRNRIESIPNFQPSRTLRVSSHGIAS